MRTHPPIRAHPHLYILTVGTKQLRRVRSTVYLTGKQTNKTRRRVVDLLAPQREDVVAATAAGLRAPCHKPGIMSLGNLADLEAGRGGTETDASLFPANLDHFRGLLRDNDDAGRTAMGADDDDESEMSSALGGSMWGGGSSLAGGSALGARPSQGASGGTEVSLTRTIRPRSLDGGAGFRGCRIGCLLVRGVSELAALLW